MHSFKRIALAVLLLLCVGNVEAITETEKLASLCQVWGLLKYHHPVVGRGKRDWDVEFMSHVRPVLAATSKEELSTIYLAWIADLGSYSFRKKAKPLPASATTYTDNKWMDNSAVFTDSLSSLLHSIQQARQRRKNYYAHRAFFGLGLLQLRHENAYKDSVYPAAPMRLLCLSRYWNTINYYYPYKNIMDRNWDTILYQMAPAFLHAEDTVAYHMAIRRTIAAINDSHAGFYTPYTAQYFGRLTTPFKCNIIENKAIVTGTWNDSLTKADDIQYGDIITHIDGRPVSEVLAACKPFICASNNAAMLVRAGYGILFAGNTDTCMLTIDRAGVTLRRSVHRYPLASLVLNQASGIQPQWKYIDSTIGYVDMGKLKLKNVKKAMSELRDTKAIIFDVRNYPSGTIYKLSRYLTPRRTPFVQFVVQASRRPGSFAKMHGPQKTARPVKHVYTGRTIFLFNGYTQSHAEYTCMAFKTVPNSISVGSQTSGADGNVVSIPLPGGYSTLFTGLGTYYPDGTATQRIGIVPDIQIEPTIPGTKAHQDEVLDRAIILAKTGK